MRRAAVALLLLGSCGLGEAPVVGRWQNRTQQYLEIREDLTGILTQTATCAPTIEVAMERDPFGAFALRIDPHQKVYFPEAQRSSFRAESFCSSTGTKPMCNFCRVEGTRMSCDVTEQEIVGSGVRVVHDCVWLAVETTTTSTVPPRICGPSARNPSCTDDGEEEP